MNHHRHTTSNRQQQLPRARSIRKGVTLLEALLATVILAGALASLSQLATNGINAALRIENDTIAAMKCQTRLDEILAAPGPTEFGRDIPYPDNPSWTWRSDVSDGPAESLALLSVTVRRSGRSSAEATFRLSRLVSRRTLENKQSSSTSRRGT